MSRLSSLLARVLKWAALALAGIVVVALAGAALAFYLLVEPQWSKFGTKPDEAMAAGRTRATFHAAGDEYFVRMDKQLLVKPADPSGYPPSILRVASAVNANPEDIRKSAVRGQDMWIVWTGGNDRFWDYASTHTAGAFDLLKTLSSYKSADPRRSMYYGRRNRWSYLGLVNEPCFVEADGPDPARYGLWLDRRDNSCPPDPFADRRQISGREDRRSRAHGSRRLLLRRAQRNRRPAPVSEPGLRRSGQGALGSGALLHRSLLLQRPEARAALSGGHVLRLLPCRAQARPTRRPIPRTRSGRTSPRTSARNITGSTAFSSGTPGRAAPTRRRRRTRAISSISCSTPIRPARSTPRSFRRTTSTIRAR